MNRFGIYDRLDFEGSEYIVKKGDSLYKIGKEYNIPIEELIKANILTGNTIYPNQVLVIPKKVVTGGVYFEEYVVKPEDTIEKIAYKNDITIDDLANYNDLSKLVLAENQVLKIPGQEKTYVIEEGDTIDSILDKTNMTLEDLVELNINGWLVPGQTIFIK